MEETDQEKRQYGRKFPENKEQHQVLRKHQSQHGTAEKKKVDGESSFAIVCLHVLVGEKENQKTYTGYKQAETQTQ
jgi:hypothetical protein